MRKNKMMRVASGLLVAVLLTTCIISGTFAKYTTTASSTDKARVAVWGFDKTAAIDLDLFDSTYDEGAVKANDNDNLIAPGTTKAKEFSIINASDVKPEVKYELIVSVDGSKIAESIKENENIVWKLDNNEFGTWNDLMGQILSLSGTTTTYDGTTNIAKKTYEAGTIPDALAKDKQHTITWKWIYDKDAENNAVDKDSKDTEMGNLAVIQDTEVEVHISVTATQLDN